MDSGKMLLRIPERQTLVGVVTKALREGLQHGHWQNHLPSERRLGEELQVSRETIRRALQALEHEGLVAVKSRSRRTIKGTAQPAAALPAVVALLAPISLEQNVSRIILRTDRLRHHLANAGLELVIRHGARYFSARHHKALQQVTEEVSARCWILQGSTQEVQRWFFLHRMPALVMGHAFEGIDLPSIDLDFQAITRHAAGTLLARGHRKVVSIGPDVEYAGEYYARLGMQEAVAKSKNPGAEVVFLKHDGTVRGLCRSLDRVFLAKDAPTAIVARAKALYTAISHLAQRGLVATRDYAFIARDDDPGLSLLVPSVARYEFDPAQMAHRLFVTTMKIAQRQYYPAYHIRLMPRFISGESLECRALSSRRTSTNQKG